MAPIATALIIIGILGFLWLDRNGARMSRAAWVPFFWLLIASSRPVSSWGEGPASRSEQYLDGSPLDRNILMLLIFFGLIVLSQRLKQVRAILGANGPVIVFLLYCLMSILWAEYPFVTFKRWVRGSADIVMVLIVLTEVNWESSLQAVISRVAYVLVPLSILFIRFYPELGRSYSMAGNQMWTGVCTDKNALGALCMICGVVVLWRLMNVSSADQKDRRRQLIALGTVFAMILYLLSIIDSKTALVCFALASMVVLLRRPFRSPIVVFVYVVSAVLVCYLVVTYGVGGEALEAMGRNATLTGRTSIWQAVLSFVERPMIGFGYENFWMGERLNALRRMGGNSAHNGYLEIYLNLGWIGVGLLTAIILTGYGNMIGEIRTKPESTRLKVAFFLICVIYNFTEAAFKMMSLAWLMFLLATMASPRQVISDLQSRASNAVMRSRRIVLAPNARMRQRA